MSSAPRQRTHNQKYQRVPETFNAAACLCSRVQQQVHSRRPQQVRVPVPENCKYFQTEDGCRNGDKCRFRHDLPKDNYRTKACKYFLHGECRNGDECTYRHDPPELNPHYRTKPCKYFQTEEGCRNGDKCRYKHEDAHEDAHGEAD